MKSLVNPNYTQTTKVVYDRYTMDAYQIFPCPSCDLSFNDHDGLINHALRSHNSNQLIELLRMKTLTKDDFRQVDSHWIFVIGNFHLSLTPNAKGEFCLNVFGSIEPIPPATQYPTEPEWDKALELANKFVSAYVVALDRDKGN